MSLSSNPAQMRELTELRNHLKWLDEERRKSSRKMAELEQRLAQQGRELADRDQKITDLERHVANFGQRFDDLPDAMAGASDVEQRLQDLEWHVSSMNTTLSRVPSPEDEQKWRQGERDYLEEEIARAISSTYERVESSQASLETQLRSEIAALHDADDWQSLAVQLEGQAGEIDSLRRSYTDLSGRVRESIGDSAADFQSNINTLAQSIQDHIDERLGEMANQQQAWESRLGQLADQQQAWESRLGQLEQNIDDTLAQSVRIDVDDKFEALAGWQQTWGGRLDQLEQNVGAQANARETMAIIDRLEQELELRQAEELRLSNLLAMQEERLTPLAATVEDLGEINANLSNRLIDAESAIQELAAQSRDVNDNLRPVLSEANRRIASFAEKITTLTNSAMKTEAGMQALSGDHMELRERSINATDSLQLQQDEIVRRLEGWQTTMDENKDTIERFSQQWISLSNQYKEARMAVQNFAHWQKQLEQQKRESSELLRLESNRMQTRWEGFLLEIQEKLKNFEIDFGQKWQAFELENEQKWSATRRSEKMWREEISAVDDLIQKLQQDNRNLIWRVQSAQADAIKKWPRLLMEEVEKAVEVNPNRRLTSITAPPSGEMSVVDAIEQGLITIDYNDDPDTDDL